jgi:hypothetical protein
LQYISEIEFLPSVLLYQKRNGATYVICLFLSSFLIVFLNIPVFFYLFFSRISFQVNKIYLFILCENLRSNETVIIIIIKLYCPSKIGTGLCTVETFRKVKHILNAYLKNSFLQNIVREVGTACIDTVCFFLLHLPYFLFRNHFLFISAVFTTAMIYIFARKYVLIFQTQYVCQ